MEYTVESKRQEPKGLMGNVAITPPINETYWLYRVHLFEDQYLLAFPKFWTVGIGFAQEEDWNTNLPASCDAAQIMEHIKHNRKYDQITDEMIVDGIKALQSQIIKDMGLV
jgi:hypothetical protein